MIMTSSGSGSSNNQLDKVLYEDNFSIIFNKIGTGYIYNMERLKELLKVTDQYNELGNDEVKIVNGALVLKEKTFNEVMTHLDCYMLPLPSVLN